MRKQHEISNWKRGFKQHIHALEFFGGVATLAVPDNTKTAVTRGRRYDPDLNPTLSRVRGALQDGSRAGAAVTNHAIPHIAPVLGTPLKWYLNPHQSAIHSCFGAVESIY
jgi:hypothetical protein